MTQEEFIQVLKEDKFFEDFKEHSLHRYPAVRYYFDHYVTLISDKGKIFPLEPNTVEGYRLINYCFQEIKLRLKL